MILELFADVVPKTSENFRQFCTGEYRKDGIPLGYKGANFHRVIKDFMIQGGDFVNVRIVCHQSNKTKLFPHQYYYNIQHSNGRFSSFVLILNVCASHLQGDGTGVISVYGGGTFADENFSLKHDSPGLLSMANSGKDTNGCQFFITCAKCNFLDSKHVVFGRVLDGLLIMRKIENVPTGPNNKPKLPIVISQSGEL